MMDDPLAWMGEDLEKTSEQGSDTSNSSTEMESSGTAEKASVPKQLKAEPVEEQEMSELTINLEGMKSIRDAEALYAQIQAAFDDGKAVIVNAEATLGVDTSIAQLLYAAIQEAKRGTGSFELINVSDSIKDTFKYLGLDMVFH